MKTFPCIYTLTYENFNADFKSIQSFLNSQKPKKILDLGAGFGRTLPLYSEIDEVVLVDYSEEMCTRLKNKVKIMGKAYTIIHAPSYGLPFEDDTFDAVIIGFAALAEMEPLLFTIGEVARVLKPGGAFYSMTINPNAFKTGSLGLDRAVKNSWNEAVSIETIPVFGKGKFQFEVQLITRQLGKLSKLSIEQTCPDVAELKSLLESFAFQINSIAGDFENRPFSENSPLIVLNAIKNVKKYSHLSKIENSYACEYIYDTMASKYKDISSSESYNLPNWLKRQMLPYKELYPVVLDCACATGNLCEMLDSISLTPSLLFGVDISLEMVKLSRATGRYDSVVQADLASGIPFFRENYFDFSIVNGCLEFIETATCFLSSLLKASAPGGILLCTFEESLSAGDQIVPMRIGNTNLKRYLRTKESVEHLISVSGWKLEEIESGLGYVSPATGLAINYWYCKARKVL
ncbi:MAG: hypothetical protein B7Y39_02175 [Bdellovibrio sp. 28-41-41]|nr:MAG: hypothetical protein B7Y39_02175 [Bdellovibrio sp. 28-41-41]